MRTTPILAVLSAMAAVLLPLLVHAGPGHDHGDAAPVATGPALPRFAAVSETFELVGVLNGKQLTLYLDRADDNAPVTDALIELEIGSAKFKAQKQDDAYQVELAAVPPPGVLPITATVTAGQEIDLLAGDLDIVDQAHAHGAAHQHSWKEYAGWAGAGLLALVVLILVGQRFAARRQSRAGAAA